MFLDPLAATIICVIFIVQVSYGFLCVCVSSGGGRPRGKDKTGKFGATPYSNKEEFSIPLCLTGIQAVAISQASVSSQLLHNQNEVRVRHVFRATGLLKVKPVGPAARLYGALRLLQ